MARTKRIRRSSHKGCGFNKETRLRYILRNANKADCSFLVKDRNNENSQKILKGFKWILSDMSPYFKTMFEANSNCKEMPIDDPYFEDFLMYVHTGVLPDLPDPTESFERLLEMYERAKIYDIRYLEDVIWNKLNSMIDNDCMEGKIWICCFELLHTKKLKISDLEWPIERALDSCRGVELKEVIKMSMKKIVKFDVDLFITLITYVSRHNPFAHRQIPVLKRSIVLKTIETYLKRNSLFVKKIKKDNRVKSAFVLMLYINFNPMQVETSEFEKYPIIKQLLK